MQRSYRYLIAMLVTSMAFSSCTCSEEAPEVQEKKVASRKGFGASLPTARRGDRREDDVALQNLKPTHKPTMPPAPKSPTIGGEVSIPEDFPEDVPVYENAKPFHVQKLPQDANSVLFKADGETKEIYDFYHSKMASQGWNVAQEYQAKEQSFLSFKKGKMITNMTISKDPKTGKQIIAIMYYEEKELPFKEF